ncbi:MAG TPA: histidine kinase [Bacteroidales bacterium]|nr:histidine kinase [Bacteroidales bacterium]
MKESNITGLLDQKKPFSHIAIIVIASLATFYTVLKQENAGSIVDILSVFILIVTLIEVFIFIALKIFTELNANITGKEFTRIVIKRFILFILICFVASLVIYLIFKYAVTLIAGDDLSMVFSRFRNYELIPWIKTTLSGLVFGAFIFIIIQWQDAMTREQKLREENLIFQNETLKSQVNPHFLFNSLNTISSLIHTQPEAAEQFINNLSMVYRYILENGQKDSVPLQSELNFITDYFNLHKIRDEEKIILDINAQDAGQFRILPVSLQILLENAIKHNIASRENQLRISIYTEDEQIVVRNNLRRKSTQIVSTKLGLKNLAERVRLTCKTDLVIEESKEFFTVKLPLIK